MQVPYLSEFISHLKSAKLDDVWDRAHFMYTPWILLFFTLLIGSKQTFGDPIICFTPAEFPDNWGKYIHQYCFATGTYHTHNATTIDEDIPKISVDYYQWVPYFMALQALFFYAPHFLWMNMQNNFEVDYKNIVERCSKARSKSHEERQKEVKEVAMYLRDAIRARHRGTVFSSLGWLGTTIYLFTKFLNVANVIIQLHFLNMFIGQSSTDWLYNILSKGYKGEYWETTGYFPRVSFCDVNLTRIGQPDGRRIQCALIINMLNEKAFVVVYLWMLAVLIPSMVNLIYSVFMFTLSCLRVWQARRYIRHVLDDRSVVNHSQAYNDIHFINRFVTECISFDGLLLLRFVESHAGFLIASELACELFNFYEENDDFIPNNNRRGYVNTTFDVTSCPQKPRNEAPSLTESLNSGYVAPYIQEKAKF